jgi:hypothetical protein
MKAYVVVEILFHAFSTSALEGSEWSASCLIALPPAEVARFSIRYEALRVPEAVSTIWGSDKYIATVGNRIEISRPSKQVAQSLHRLNYTIFELE